MTLLDLALYGFRNYDSACVRFVPGVNLIVGDNAQGKTNLLEAITYLSTGRSFRTRTQADLIGFGKDFADLQAKVFSQEREQSLRAVLFAGRRPRQLYIGGVKQRTQAGLAGVLTTVLFCPEDLLVLKAGAASRRRLLDTALCQLRPGYETALTEYSRLYEGKSRILRGRLERPSLLSVLPEYNLRMAQVGAVLVSYRAKYLKELDRQTARFHGAFSGGKEQLQLRYQTVSTIADPFGPAEELTQAILDHQASHERAELESGQCLTGPHKDDFEVLLEGKSLKSFGSQGQTRTAAISLKLAEREILRQDAGDEPVLLLDDVLSELDPGRQDFVLNHIRSGQVIITCCEKDRLTEIGQVLTVQGGRLIGGE